MELTEKQLQELKDHIAELIKKQDPNYVQIPDNILSWREGDPITQEHRELMALLMARSFGDSEEQRLQTISQLENLPDSFTAGNIAVVIAVQTGMGADAFRETFPTIAKESKNLSVIDFLSWKK